MKNNRLATLFGCFMIAALAAGCSPDFEPFSRVSDLRVMAIGGDSPALAPGETTTLRALVHASEGQTVSYSWDWCPFATGPTNEYACEFGEMPAEDGEAGMELPPLDFSLGEGAEVQFTYPVPSAVLRDLCDTVQDVEDIPDFVNLPDCAEEFPITVRLIVTHANGERVVAIKKFELLYDAPTDELERNLNPEIAGVRLGPKGSKREDAELLVDGTPFDVNRETEYALFVDVDEDQSQVFLRPDADGSVGEFRENLAVLWFAEHGERDEDRTGYIDGIRSFDDLTTNTFTTPERDDYRDDELRLYFVIQDERGGIGWTERVLRLQ